MDAVRDDRIKHTLLSLYRLPQYIFAGQCIYSVEIGIFSAGGSGGRGARSDNQRSDNWDSTVLRLVLQS